MFQFFEQIGHFLGNVVDYFITIIKNLFQFFLMIGSVINFLVEMVAALPEPVHVAAMVIVLVSVLFLIIGR